MLITVVRLWNAYQPWQTPPPPARQRYAHKATTARNDGLIGTSFLPITTASSPIICYAASELDEKGWVPLLPGAQSKIVRSRTQCEMPWVLCGRPKRAAAAAVIMKKEERKGGKDSGGENTYTYAEARRQCQGWRGASTFLNAVRSLLCGYACLAVTMRATGRSTWDWRCLRSLLREFSTSSCPWIRRESNTHREIDSWACEIIIAANGRRVMQSVIVICDLSSWQQTVCRYAG